MTRTSFSLLLIASVVASSCGGDESGPTPPVGGPPSTPGASVRDATPTTLADLVDGRYQLENVDRVGRCLLAASETETSNAPCDVDYPSQRWTLTLTAPEVVWIASGSNGRALDVSGASTAVGATVGLWPYGDGAAHRQFRVRSAGPRAFELESVNAPGLCVGLSASGGGELAPCGGSAPTRWLTYRVRQSATIGRGLATPGCVATPALGVRALPSTALGGLVQAYDPDARDTFGPTSFDANYGTRPELVTIASGTGLDVLIHDQALPTRGVIAHLEPAGASFDVTQLWEVDLLGTVMGFARDAAGVRYYATGVDEADRITPSYPPPGVHRPRIVRVVGFDETGCVRAEIDVDLARGYRQRDSELIIRPMVAATSRLTLADGVLALVHGTNTDTDPGGTRHQKALTTHLDTETGEALRTDSIWVSHSFDQRQLWDGEAFVELHHGDAYPRGLALGRFIPRTSTGGGHLAYRIKGNTGDNTTHTNLGGLATIATGDYGYVAVFTTERGGAVTDPNGDRDLALLRVRRDFSTLDASAEIVDPGGTAQAVTVDGAPMTNHVVWLTDYASTEGAAVSADRSRVVALDDRYLILWERSTGGTFDGTWGMIVDAAASTLVPATRLGDSRLSRADDPVRLGPDAAAVTGAPSGLVVTLVSATLDVRRVAVP